METEPDRFVEHILSTITDQLGGHSSCLWHRDEATGMVNIELCIENGKLLSKYDPALAQIYLKVPMENVWQWPEI